LRQGSQIYMTLQAQHGKLDFFLLKSKVGLKTWEFIWGERGVDDPRFHNPYYRQYIKSAFGMDPTKGPR
jgi:hypothetical protein